jgi:hypothetical protein
VSYRERLADHGRGTSLRRAGRRINPFGGIRVSPVLSILKGPGTLPRSHVALAVCEPSAGDVTPSPSPSTGSRYDLSRLYSLRRRVIADEPRESCGRLRRVRELPRDHSGQILIGRPQRQEGPDEQAQRDRLVPGSTLARIGFMSCKHLPPLYLESCLCDFYHGIDANSTPR